jgi:hypothetical protein
MGGGGKQGEGWLSAPPPPPPPLRQNWLAAALFTAGLVLRVLAIVSYRPVLFYIDTVRYLYDSGGNDPVGYRLPLRAILAIGNFDLLAIIQHLLGLAMAATIYLVLVRRGTPRWLAAFAIAPVLLDAYQLQMEQLVLPDVWFEALVVAGIAVLLIGTSPARPPALKAVIAGGLILGVSATFRQVGEILILPALIYLLAVSGGWRPLLTRAAALLVAFVVPILAYLTGSYLLVGHFYLSHSGVTTTYGRMASAANCAALNLPPVERGLCPTRAQQARGPDWLEHDPRSPIKRYYTGPLSARASSLVSRFNNAVLSQQPTRLLASYLADVGKVFALSKVTVPGITPLSRWQFQTRYPYLSPHATPAQVLRSTARFGGGKPTIWHPGATALRRYQLGGGYTPGPLLALCALAGLVGSAAALAARYRDLRPRRRPTTDDNPPAAQIKIPATAPATELPPTPTTSPSNTSPANHTPANDEAAEPGTGDAQPPTTGPSSASFANHPSSAKRATTPPTDSAKANAHPTNTSPGGAKHSSGGEEGAGSAASTGSAWRELALGCLLFFGCGAGLLLMSDVFEFSWRYQLPALVTLPPAGAAVVAGIVRRRASGPARPGKPGTSERRARKSFRRTEDFEALFDVFSTS